MTTKTQTQHTAGPWMIEHNDYGIYVKQNINNQDNGKLVCKVSGFENGCNLPNAKLIASVPELLDALKEIAALDYLTAKSDIQRIALDAIARAEGRGE